MDLDTFFEEQSCDDNFDDLGEILEEIFDAETQCSRVQNEVSQNERVEVVEESPSFTVDNIGYHPKYVMFNIPRGDAYDTFYHKPLYDKMIGNEQVINVINSGKQNDILGLANFACQTPGTKAKCDQALECKFFTDVTMTLMLKYNVMSAADVYRRVALLSDRMCGGCDSKSSKVACLCGKWRCRNCEKKGKDISFMDGLEEWLRKGSPTRHTQTVLPR